VADKLRRLDQVAYVRFASVYRQFKTLEELVDEAKAVLDARRYDDPDQGKLFLESPAQAAQATQATGENGDGGRSVAEPDATSTAPTAPPRGRGKKRQTVAQTEPATSESV
jgi:hypothetical protein